MLTVADVSVRFAGLSALTNVSMEVPRNSIAAVIGPNGAGKSTLFNVISGFYTPSAGAVHIDGHDISGLRPHEIARLGVSRTFQNLELSGSESVLNNIMLGTHLSGRSGVWRNGWRSRLARREESNAHERAVAAAHLVGLQSHLDASSALLPYGMQKRIEIARALAGQPKLLLLDEPVAGMAASEVDEMAEVLRKLHGQLNLTILLIEHDIEFTLGLADSVTVLDFGVAIAAGDPEEIRSHPEVIKAYLGA